MKKTNKILVIISIAFLFSICFSCFKTELKKIRIFDVELEVYNQNLDYLTEGDTCDCKNLKIMVDLIDQNVASLILPSFIRETYAFTVERYFDFTNEIEDINIYIQDTKNDSIEITNNCIFTFDNNEFSDKEQLIKSCNNKMDYYKDNTIKWPSIDFSFNIDTCYVDSTDLRSIIVYLKMSDDLIRGETGFLNIENKN
jgi:hypothetical protein